MNEEARVREIYRRVSEAAQNWPTTSLDYYQGQPFKALIAGMLSAQTREEQTLQAAEALFALADNPDDLLNLTDEQIFQAVRVVSYAESKAKYVREIAQRLVDVDGGVVPSGLDQLMAYRGVGWKVAVLTRQVAFGIHDDITVDVHVNRVGKRLGLVRPDTKAPIKINEELKQALPREFWPRWNPLMVQFGRIICQPTYPQCGKCILFELCPRTGVIQTGPRTYKNAEYA